MNKLLYLFFVCITVTLVSCSDYLDVKNSNQLAVPDKLEDLQALLDNFEVMNMESTPSYLESAADDYFLTEEALNAVLEGQRPVYQWAPIENNYPNDWSRCYTIVYNANFCLDMLKNISRNARNGSNWDNVYGSALFFRAYSYLGLLWTFAPAYELNGDNSAPAIVLRTSSDFNESSRLSNTKECYERVIEDARKAADLLPEVSLFKTRPSKAAAYGLLARIYLSMSMYEEAYKYADLALAIDDQLLDYNKPEDGIDINSESPFQRFNIETVFYNDITTNFLMHSPWYAYIDSTLYDSFENEDLRKKAFFSKEGDYAKFKGTYSNSITFLFSGITTAELLFIKMEGLARIGDYTEAVALLRYFLQFRWDKEKGIPIFDVNSREDAVRLILLERRKELMMRGLRLADVKRLNLKDAKVTMKRKINNEIIELLPNDTRVILNRPNDLFKYLK